MPSFTPFALERLLSTWENRVEYNLSESGVAPLTLAEFASVPLLSELGMTPLGYPHANGSPELREQIAALYPGAGPDNVLVTVGAVQANFSALSALTEPGDAIALMQPNYQQFWGLAQNFDRRVSTFGLVPKSGWRLDTDALTRAVRPETTFVAVVNPNNPTGRILGADERTAIVAAAARAGAWLLADEVYAGTEHRGDDVTPTFYGEYERVLAVNSMSKSYGLPGLRIGWIVGPAEAIATIWAWQDYVTISAGKLDGEIAAHALSPEVRLRLFARARAQVRSGYANVERWAAARDDVDAFAPDAAAICVVKYGASINATDLAKRLIAECSVLVGPGDTFGIDGFLRLSFGLPDEYVNEGLRRIGALLDRL